MERKVNNFVQNALNLGAIKNDLSLLRLAFTTDENLAKAENILENARMILVGILGGELDDYTKINSDLDVGKNIAEAIVIVELLPSKILPNKDDMIDVLKSCVESFNHENVTSVISTLKQDKEKFRKQIILLQDICAEEFLN
jgi:hypothetical protein